MESTSNSLKAFKNHQRGYRAVTSHSSFTRLNSRVYTPARTPSTRDIVIKEESKSLVIDFMVRYNKLSIENSNVIPQNGMCHRIQFLCKV